MWSAAELLLGQPIFLGDIEVDQLVEIIKILGILNTAAQNLLQNTKIFYHKMLIPFHYGGNPYY